jgi:phosphocarrier protein HPr
MLSGSHQTCFGVKKRDAVKIQDPIRNSQRADREVRLGNWELWSWALISRVVTVTNRLGMHARAAARFVHLAARFESQIRVGHDAKMMDGKSIMGILLLAAAHGKSITITADGPDENAAIDALCDLVHSGFGEEAWNA